MATSSNAGQGLATLNLLRDINTHPVELEETEADAAPAIPGLPAGPDPRDPEARKLFRGCLIVVCSLGVLAIVLDDIDRRTNPRWPATTEEQIAAMADRFPVAIHATVKPMQAHAWKECLHMELKQTPYTYGDCKYYTASGQWIIRKEGM